MSARSPPSGKTEGAPEAAETLTPEERAPEAAEAEVTGAGAADRHLILFGLTGSRANALIPALIPVAAALVPSDD